jgi:hypothetical protein
MARNSVSSAARPRPAVQSHRTLRGWAIGILLETHAIKECTEHGHMRDQTDPLAWQDARELAAREPFPGATPDEAIHALDDVMRSIGDSCPGCN